MDEISVTVCFLALPVFNKPLSQTDCVMMARLRIGNKSKKNDFKKVRTLGSGAFGFVDLCTVEEDKSYAKKGEQVAIKRMKTVSHTEFSVP